MFLKTINAREIRVYLTRFLLGINFSNYYSNSELEIKIKKLSLLKNLLKIEINPERVYGLDILRALAIIYVIAGHGGCIIPEESYKYVKQFLLDGVSLFFVLSGFLIGGILIKVLKNNAINTKLIFSFWIKRWFRTVPNYFLILSIVLLLNVFFTEGFNAFDYKFYFIFSQNLFTEHPDFFSEAWSLSVEEWFYLLIPIVLFILIKGLKISIEKALIITVVSIIISVTLFRYYRFDTLTIDTIRVWDKLIRSQVFTRLDSLMYGIIGAYVYHYHTAFWNKYKIVFLILGLFLFVSTRINLFGFETLGLYKCVFSFTITSIATLFTLPYLSSLKTGKGFVYKTLTYLSLISYSMYLVNMSIVQKWILGPIDWSLLENYNTTVFLLTRYALYWLITIVISILIYKYFELPMLNLRDKIKIK